MKKFGVLIGLAIMALIIFNFIDSSSDRVGEDLAVVAPDKFEPVSDEVPLPYAPTKSDLVEEPAPNNHLPIPQTQHLKVQLSELQSEGGESSFSQSYKLVARGLKFSDVESTYMIEFDQALSGVMSVILVGDQGETELSSSNLVFDSMSKKLFRGDWIKSDLQESNLQQIALTAKSPRGHSSSLSLYVQVLGDLE